MIRHTGGGEAPIKVACDRPIDTNTGVVDHPIPKYNQFRACDALEFADAYRRGCRVSGSKLWTLLQGLALRMRRLEAKGGEIPTYVLAAYRGYEAAQIWYAAKRPPGLVTLDDREGQPGVPHE